MKRSILSIASLGGALAPLASAHAQGWGGNYPGARMMWDYGWHGWFLGPLAMILFWGLLIAAVVLVVRWLTGPAAGPAGSARAPLDILKERFARGEIGKEEFEERRRVMES